MREIKLYATKVGRMYWMRDWDASLLRFPIIVLSRPFAEGLKLFVVVLTWKGIKKVDERICVYEESVSSFPEPIREHQ
jgi:hypothetical protein